MTRKYRNPAYFDEQSTHYLYVLMMSVSLCFLKSLCVCDLEELLDIKQSKLSYHLKKLVDANVLIAEKHGTWNYYKINEQQIQVVLNEDTCCKIL